MAEGERLFLVITPVSDMYVGNGSRTPGVLTFSGLQVGVPRPQA